jgi:hypothetical protein
MRVRKNSQIQFCWLFGAFPILIYSTHRKSLVFWSGEALIFCINVIIDKRTIIEEIYFDLFYCNFFGYFLNRFWIVFLQYFSEILRLFICLHLMFRLFSLLLINKSSLDFLKEILLYEKISVYFLYLHHFVLFQVVFIDLYWVLPIFILSKFIIR